MARNKHSTRDCQATASGSRDVTVRTWRADDGAVSKTHSAEVAHSTDVVPTTNGLHPISSQGLTPASKAATDNFTTQADRHVATGKRPRNPDKGGNFHALGKRQKLDSEHSSKSNASNNVIEPLAPSTLITDSACEASIPKIPVIAQRLRDRFDFSAMSILSSSKIESRVRNLLRKTGYSAHAKPDAKPVVVILRAKAKVAGKMCSIVEIAKEQIKRDKGTFWQYSFVHAELLELKPKLTKKASKRNPAQKDNEQDESRDAGTEGTEQQADTSLKDQDQDQDQDQDRSDEDGHAEEEAFETTTNPRERVHTEMIDRSRKKKVRNTPVMTIFFARVPVPGLKQVYGEQTNA